MADLSQKMQEKFNKIAAEDEVAIAVLENITPSYRGMIFNKFLKENMAGLVVYFSFRRAYVVLCPEEKGSYESVENMLKHDLMPSFYESMMAGFCDDALKRHYAEAEDDMREFALIAPLLYR